MILPLFEHGRGALFPAFLTWRAGVDKFLIDPMCPLFDGSFRPERFSDMLLELHSRMFTERCIKHEYQPVLDKVLNANKIENIQRLVISETSLDINAWCQQESKGKRKDILEIQVMLMLPIDCPRYITIPSDWNVFPSIDHIIIDSSVWRWRAISFLFLTSQSPSPPKSTLEARRIRGLIPRLIWASPTWDL